VRGVIKSQCSLPYKGTGRANRPEYKDGLCPPFFLRRFFQISVCSSFHIFFFSSASAASSLLAASAESCLLVCSDNWPLSYVSVVKPHAEKPKFSKIYRPKNTGLCESCEMNWILLVIFPSAPIANHKPEKVLEHSSNGSRS